MNRSAYSILLAFSGALLLTGCFDDHADLHAWVARHKLIKGQQVFSLPVISTFKTFTYQQKGLRDPFSPVLSKKIQDSRLSGSFPDQKRIRQPLEQFPLKSLKMVGTLSMGSKMQALIEDPEHMIHQVGINQYMGQHYGRITAVKSDHIELTEMVSNGAGGWIRRPVSIMLSINQDQGGR